MDKHVRNAIFMIVTGLLVTTTIKALQLSEWINAGIWFLVLIWILKNWKK